ncbi:MAG TPA: ester cyclase [Thermomicrobiales bacterium]|nr:ester cyclase [Thermomicrobiales bacterium]
MSAEANKAVVRRFIDEAIGKGDLATFREVCAADFVWHGASMGEFHDLDSFLQGAGPLFAALAGVTPTTEDLVAAGDKVVARYHWQATHQGELFGVPATGRTVRVSGLACYRIAGGQIAEEWVFDDWLGLMQQVGALPAPAA